jgi:peptidylprolyl isomerase
MTTRLFIAAIVALMFTACAQSQNQTKVIVHTSLGDMTIVLYNETPKHRDNFIKLANEHYFDSLLFHRVINGFMIQGGDPQSKNAPAGQMLGNGGPSYKIPAEIVFPNYFHKKGALAAARMSDQQNPQKESSGSQFYIVQGEIIGKENLPQLESMLSQKKKQQAGYKAIEPFADSLRYYQQVRDSAKWANVRDRAVAAAEKAAEAEPAFVMPQAMKDAYSTIGGTPSLDGEYTVFGEVVSGLEVIDKIAAVQRDGNDRPLQDVKMWIEVVK